MIYSRLQPFWPVIATFALFTTAIIFRPLLPIDETRYMTVAWEMWLRGDWFAPLTVNFELYHHKPPLLFWLINGSWSIFGVSRWAGLVPIVMAATACVYLTQILAYKLLEKNDADFRKVPFVMMGSLPFLIYNTVVMFDITLTMFVLMALLALISYAKERNPIYVVAVALALGLGVLTKGPVAWLYIIFPVLLAPYWVQGKQNWVSWYVGCFLAFVLSTIPVLLWLVPVLKASNPDFAFSLIWEQTAGRITGHMDNTHKRPIYFYLPILPLLLMPWALFPSFWVSIRDIKDIFKVNAGIRFIACWVFPVIIAFSFISGKQPHYLIPLLPGILIFIAYTMRMTLERISKISIAMIFILIIAQGISSQIIFKKYDLQPIADYLHTHQNTDWSFVPKYQGELGFLGRIENSIDVQQRDEIRSWFKTHPQGMAVIRYDKAEEVSDLKAAMTMPYRDKNIGIFYSYDLKSQ